MNSSMRMPLPLHSPAPALSAPPLSLTAPSSARRKSSSGLWLDRDREDGRDKQPPGKVTTLDHIISQQGGGKESFCGQSARSSHEGGASFMSKSFSGSRGLLDHRMDRTRSQEGAVSSSAGASGSGSGSGSGGGNGGGHSGHREDYGQFSSFKNKNKSRRADQKTINSSAPEHCDSQVSIASSSLDEYPEALRKEIADLQQALIDKFRGSNKLVSGAQFRSSGPGQHKCDMCESKDNSLKKAKETIRSLRFHLSQAEEKVYNKSSNANSGNRSGEVNSARDQPHMTGEWAVIRERNEELAARVKGLEHSNYDLRKQLESEKNKQDNGKFSLNAMEEDEATRQLRKEHANTEKKCEDLQYAAVEYEKMMVQLKDQLNLKCAYAKDLEEELSTLKQTPKAPSPPKRSQIQDLEERLSQAEEAANTMRKERDVSRKQFTDQAAENKNNELEVQRLSKLQQDHLEDLEEARATIDRLRTELNESNVKGEQAREEAAAAQQLVDQLREELLALKAQLDSKQSRLNDVESDLITVRSDADSANSKMNSMLRRMTTESENSAKAIQKAISSSVRLCVVAPTVNVHVADKKMKFRSNVPKDDLEKFLQDQVLSKYTFLFEQSQENCAPDGVTDLQPWIKKILSEMQESVENHISSAMKNGH